MILDPTDQFITHITAQCDIVGKTILEVGCGRGRITRDLARHARRVVAIDPDEGALQAARSQVAADNVVFVRCGGEKPSFAEGSFDLVVYALSLHHLPADSMLDSLLQAAKLLRGGGKIVVIEPSDDGTLIEAEERFGVGCGNERLEKAAAQGALHSLAGWSMGDTVRFQTLFYFEGLEDFLDNLLPAWRHKPKTLILEIEDFLAAHAKGGMIILHADRRMNILTRRKN